MLSLPTPPKCFAASVLASLHADFARKVRARPSDCSTFEAIWVHLRYGPVTRSPSLKMASSIGFRIFSFHPSCYSSYGAWTLTPVGLAPTDHASLRWTHTSRYQSAVDECIGDWALADELREIAGRKPVCTGTDRSLLRSVLGPWSPVPKCEAPGAPISVEEHTSMVPRPRRQSQNSPLRNSSAIPA